MNPREERTMWLVTKDGIPRHLAWAKYKTMAEEADESRKSHSAALGATEPEADGWDAQPTQWRRAPAALYPHVLQHADIPLVVEGRDVVSGGLRYNLDAGGRPHPDHKAGDVREPLAPDAKLDDEAQLLAMAETLGRAVRVTCTDGTRACAEPAPSDELQQIDLEDQAAVGAQLATAGAELILHRAAEGGLRRVELTS